MPNASNGAADEPTEGGAAQTIAGQSEGPSAEHIRLAAQPDPQRGRQPAAGRVGAAAGAGGEGGQAPAREAGDRPDGAGHPPGPRGGAAQAARVPGRGAQGGADHRRLHGARGRSVGALEPAPDALRRADRREREDLPGAGAADPRRRPGAARAAPQRRMARHALDGPALAGAHDDGGAAARARRLCQTLAGAGADLAAGAAVPAAAGL